MKVDWIVFSLRSKTALGGALQASHHLAGARRWLFSFPTTSSELGFYGLGCFLTAFENGLGGSFTSKPVPCASKVVAFSISDHLDLRLDCFLTAFENGLRGELYKQAITLLAHGLE